MQSVTSAKSTKTHIIVPVLLLDSLCTHTPTHLIGYHASDLCGSRQDVGRGVGYLGTCGRMSGPGATEGMLVPQGVGEEVG